MPSEFANRIIGLLTPSLGEFTALRKVRAACKLAQIDIETLKKMERETISRNLEIVCEPLGEHVATSIRESVMEIP